MQAAVAAHSFEVRCPLEERAATTPDTRVAVAWQWFMLAEGDTFVPGLAMATQLVLASALYSRHELLLGFVRVSNDTQGRSFYSDITTPAPRSAVQTFGRRRFVTPQNTYAASWAYPRVVMQDFMRSEDWTDGVKHKVEGMRERAAWGWRQQKIVTLVDDAALRIYHLGKSGIYLVRVRLHGRGALYNTLPVGKLVV